MTDVNCTICMDFGFVLLIKGWYETKYHCTCKAGTVHAYDGTQLEGDHRSQYICRSIAEVTSTDEISKTNIRRHGLVKQGPYWFKQDAPKLSTEEIADIRKLFSGIVGTNKEFHAF